MKLHIKFLDSSFVELILFQNDAVTKWFHHFQKINADHNYYSMQMSCALIRQPQSLVDLDQYWKQIKSTLRTLDQLGYRVPFELNDHFDYDQTILNRLHRFFTYNVMWAQDNERDVKRQNPFDKNFHWPPYMNFQAWLDILDQINYAVHKLEWYTKPHANKTWLATQHPLEYMAFTPSRQSQTQLDSWLAFSAQDQAHNFGEYMDLQSPLVILDQSILGKSVLKSFCDNDDPTALDCTGRIGSFGGFEIELNNERKKIYQSSQFQQWVTMHGLTIDQLPLEFAIGYMPNEAQQCMLLRENKDIISHVQFIE